jgi:hypothetical protein
VLLDYPKRYYACGVHEFSVGRGVCSVWGSNEGTPGLITESIYFYTFEASDGAWK